MSELEKFKQSVYNGEISHETAVKELFDLLDNNKKFLDSLIEKYEEEKKLSIVNINKMRGHSQSPWYDATFNNTLLFLWDLKDIKSRSGMDDE